MFGFDYDSFVDLTRNFNLEKLGGRAALAWRLRAQPKFHPVRLIDAKKMTVKTATSKFADFKTLRIVIAPRFALAAKAPAVAPKKRTLSLKLAAATVPMAEVAVAEVAVKPAGGTLKLKTKIDLPPPSIISKRSSSADLATAFKAEMKVLTEKKTPGAETAAPPLRPQNRKASTLKKGWADLLAQAESPAAKTKDFDLRAAFKTEMKALLERQGMDTNDNAPSTGTVVPFPAKYDKFSLATKRRILGHNRNGF